MNRLEALEVILLYLGAFCIMMVVFMLIDEYWSRYKRFFRRNRPMATKVKRETEFPAWQGIDDE